SAAWSQVLAQTYQEALLLRSKERDTKDWNATLGIYFNRCQMWLIKTTRVPITNSVLKSSKLNLRLARVTGKHASRDVYASIGDTWGSGLVGTLRNLVRRSGHHSKIEDTAILRAKVHTKGILRGVTREMPPNDILTFLSYLITDGNYFPDGFFFEEEAKLLSFDPLGALRSVITETEAPETMEETIYAPHDPASFLAKAQALCAPAHSSSGHYTLDWLHLGHGHVHNSNDSNKAHVHPQDHNNAGASAAAATATKTTSTHATDPKDPDAATPGAGAVGRPGAINTAQGPNLDMGEQGEPDI
ncbi:unnamed protein product, partial [Discosporangium mesarthrocarpum]